MIRVVYSMLSVLFIIQIISCGTEPDENDSEQNDTQDSEDKDTSVASQIDDLSTLVDKAYLIKFDKGYWYSPKDVGQEVGMYVPGFVFQFKTVSDDGTFTAIVGTSDEDGKQNVCNKTFSMTGKIENTTETNGTDITSFNTDTIDIEAILSGPLDENTNKNPQTIAPIRNFSIGGIFVDQGNGFKKGTMNALMDFRDIACLFALLSEEDRNADNICGLMYDTLGYNCESCPFDTAVSHCVTMKAELFKASAVDVSIVEVAEFDRSAACLDDSACL